MKNFGQKWEEIDFSKWTRILFLAHIAEQTRQPAQVATIIYYLLLSWFRLETQLSMHPNSSFRKFLHYTNFQNCASEGIRTSQIFSIHYFVKNPVWNSNIFLKVIDQLFADFRNKFFLAFLKSTNLDKNIFLEPKAE